MHKECVRIRWVDIGVSQGDASLIVHTQGDMLLYIPIFPSVVWFYDISETIWIHYLVLRYGFT